MQYWICYDIASNRRRRGVVRCLERYGERVHESAFMAQLTPARLGRLQRRLTRLVHEEEDLLTIFPCCLRDQADVRHFGLSRAEAPPTARVV